MDTFGRYQLHEQLGQGGMGVVYRAFDTVLERVVALKLVLTPDGLDPEMRERFFREARAAGHLSHKNIVTIYDLGEHDGRPYLAMEYLDGEDLQRRLARPERMSLRHKVDLAIEICQGVEYAHAHGVIHRDLKPANIYITDSGNAKILDFGLARLVTSQLTRSNMMMGTLNYMAPEQVRGERADQRSDVFSTGVVLYELLGGRKAFEGDSVASTLYKILQEVPEPLWKVDPALPSELVTVVERSLAKLRDERYQDMASFRSDLEAIRHQQQLGTSTTPRPISASAGSGPGAQHVTRLSDAPVVAPKTDDPLTPRGGGSAVPATTSRVSGRALTIAAIAILAAGLAGTWLFSLRHRQPAAVQMPAAPTQRVEDPVAARIAAAQQALDRRDYAAAINAADAALLQAPQNADAQRIRGAARQAAVDDALRRGTAHLQTGATSDAIQAAGEALALSPDNAEARHILEQAATRTSAPDADTARRRMAEARAAAGAAGADKHAAPAFRNASRAAQDADRLYKAKRFAEAASRYYEASGLFHGAEAAARVATPPAPVAAEARPASPAQATEPSPPPPAPASPVSAAPPPQVTAPVAPPVSPPVSTSLPIAPPPAIPSPPPAAETPTALAAEERITELLGRYKDALEARSLDQMKRIWPSFGGAAETALRQEFQHATRIAVEIAEPQISVSGNTGKAIFTRRYSVVTVEGQRLQTTSSQVIMDVKRTGSGWIIEALRFPLR